ncbi:MAG TPA: hypothetical protein VI197_15405 [Polyangiaceae bacterium]
MQSSRNRWFGLCILGLAAAFPASTATAEGDKLETAQTKLAEAVQALKDAPPQGDAAAFEDHRKKAITLLTRAQGEILKAKGAEAPK